MRPLPSSRATWLLRRMALILAVGTALGLGLLWFPPTSRTLATSLLQRFLPLPEDASVEVGRAGGSWLRGLRLAEVRVTRDDGSLLWSVDTLEVRYRLGALLSRRVDVRRVRAIRPYLELRRDRDGAWELGAPTGGEVASSGPSPWTVEVAEVTLSEAAVEVGTEEGSSRVGPFALHASRVGILPALSFRLDSLAGVGRGPEADASPVSFGVRGAVEEGRASLDTLWLRSASSDLGAAGTSPWPLTRTGLQEAELIAAAPSLDLGDLTFVLPDLNPDASLVLDARIRVDDSTVPEVRVHAVLDDGSALEVEASGRLSERNDRLTSFTGRGTLSRLDPSHVVRSWPSGAISAELTADVSREEPARESEAWDGSAALRWSETRLGELDLASGSVDLESAGGEVRLEASASVAAPGAGGGSRVSASGTFEPWTDTTAFDLEARVTRTSGFWSGVTAVLTGRGRGASPRSSTGDWRLTIPNQVLNGVPLEGRLDLRSDQGKGPWDFDFRYATGRATAAGSFDLAGDADPATESTFSVVADHLRLDSLDVAGLLGNTVPSDVTGRITASARGPLVPLPELTLEMAFDRASWGGFQLPPGRGSASSSGESALLSFTGDGSGGFIDLLVALEELASVPRVEIRRGRFSRLNVLALTGAGPTSDLSGEIDGRYRGRTLVDGSGAVGLRLDSSSVGALGIGSGTAVVTLDEGTLDTEATVVLPEGRVVSNATALLASDGWSRIDLHRLDFRDVDVAALGGTATARSRLSGTVTGGASRDGAGGVTADARLSLDPSSFNDVAIEAGRGEAHLSEGRVTGDLSLDLDGGRLTGSGTADLEGSEEGNARVDVDFDLPELGRLVSLPIPAAAVGTARAQRGGGPGDPTSWAVTADVSHGFLGDAVIDSASVRAEIGPGRVDVDTVFVRSDAATLDGGGVLNTGSASAGASTFAVTADVEDAQPLAGLFGAEVLSVGSAELLGQARGAGETLAVSARARANAMLLDDLRAQGIEAELDASVPDGRSLGASTLQLTVDAVSGLGELDLERTEVAATYDTTELVVEAVARLDREREAEVRLEIDPETRGRSLHVERLRVSLDRDQWQLVAPVRVDLADGFGVSAGQLVSGPGSIDFEGGLYRTEASSFTLAAEGLRFDSFSDLLGYPTLGGELSGELRSTGSLSRPVWSASGTSTLTAGGRPHGVLDLDLAYADQRLETDLQVTDGAGHLATVRGVAPVALDFTDSIRIYRETPGDASLEISADAFNVSWLSPFLDPSVARALSGRLDIAATVSGETFSPEVGGRARLAGGSLHLPTLGTMYEEIEASVVLEGRQVRIQNGSVRSNRGSASLTGTLAVESLGLGRFDLAARLDALPLIDNELARATASGDLEMRGTTQSPELTGTLEITSADVYLQGESQHPDLEPIELTEEDYRTLREVFGYEPPDSEPTRSALYDALATNLRVVIGRDSWLRQRLNPEMSVQLSGELSFEKEPRAEPRVIGTILPIPGRSYVEQWGRRFQLESGQVEFRGPMLEPVMSLAAVYEIPSRRNPGGSEVTIRLAVEGRPDSLRLILGSTPAMDNADIVSYIATGRPAAQSLGSPGTGESISDVGIGLAADRLTATVEELAAETIGLDVVEIRREGPRDAVLVAGRYVSPRLYLGFQQPVTIGSADALAQEGPTTRAEIEYAAFRWLLLNLEGGRSDVAFFFRTRLGY